MESEIGNRKSEIGNRKSEIGNRKSEIGNRKSESENENENENFIARVVYQDLLVKRLVRVDLDTAKTHDSISFTQAGAFCRTADRDRGHDTFV